MESKYYTPEIEEFHVGFEYEVDNDPRINDWSKEIVDENSNFKYFEGEYADHRVKYLDKEDIESLGFTLIEEENKPYSHVCVFRNKLIEIFVQLNEKYFPRLVNIKSLPGAYTANFSIKIKNKSELKKLIKQLEIL